MGKYKFDRITALDITAIFFDGKNFYPKKIHMTQLLNPIINGLEDYTKHIKKSEGFVIDGSKIQVDSALCEVQKAFDSSIVDHLLEVIDSLSYTVACCKYPNHYSHEKYKEEVLIDAGLKKEFRDKILE